jgi:hypothetical protein
VHGGDGEAAAVQGAGDLVGGPLGLAEDHGQAAVLGLQHAGEHLDLVEVVGPEDMLLGQRGGDGFIGVLGPDVHRLPHVPPCERDDLAGHRGGEQHRLPRARGETDDPLHVRQEAEVEHLVRLVQDERAHAAQVEMPAVRQVKEPAGGADHDVRAGGERLDLRLVGSPAVDGEHPRAEVGARALDVVGDLDG